MYTCYRNFTSIAFSRSKREVLNSWAKSHNVVAKINYIINKTSSLNRSDIKKEDFRNKFLHMVNFLIIQKNIHPNIFSKGRWEALLREFLKDENSHKCNNDPKCINNFKEYNACIINTREVFFQNRIFKKSQAITQKIDFPRDEICDVFKDKTFHELVNADFVKYPYFQVMYGQETCTKDVRKQNSIPGSHTKKYRAAVEEKSRSFDKCELDLATQSEATKHQTPNIQSEDNYLKQNLLLQVLKHLKTSQGTIKS
ncbi:STP1 protein [Plasmodium brasilianum]|uniref:STP1 protein n=1 Tax=Plasmodium brasilianum TaxID=5824 RepID=A0ACB9YGK3_PLABR|nr:STP1 protein [Plasmodium brasilianum]